jgi:hypothetical protein
LIEFQEVSKTWKTVESSRRKLERGKPSKQKFFHAWKFHAPTFERIPKKRLEGLEVGGNKANLHSHSLKPHRSVVD